MKIKELDSAQKEKIHDLLGELFTLDLFRMCMLYNAHFEQIVTSEVRSFSIEASKAFISDIEEITERHTPEGYFDLQVSHSLKSLKSHREKQDGLVSQEAH